MTGIETEAPIWVSYIWGGLSTVILGWIAYGIWNNGKEQSAFQSAEIKERINLERKINDEYLTGATHTLLCENAGLKLAKNITEHFDEKFKEHENELKKAIKNNGHTA